MPDAADPAAPPQRAGGAPRRLWTRSVVALLLAQLFATSAALAQLTALGKLVFDLTRREIDLGFLGLAEFAPAALLVLVTGTVADRFDRRRVGALAAVAQAGVALALAAYAGGSPSRVAPIFALVAAYGTARAFEAPSIRALPADIAGADLPWLQPRFSATWQAAIILGPVLGGFAYAVDVRLPFYLAAGLVLLSGVALLLVRVPPRHHGTERVAEPAVAAHDAGGRAGAEVGLAHAEVADSAPPRAGLREAVAGLRFVRANPLLLGAISLDLFAVLFGGAVALLPAVATERLGVGAVGLGWLRAAVGLGAGATTLVLATRPVRRRVGRVLLAVVAVFGAFTVVLGLTTSYVVAFAALLVLSGADAVSVFIRATLVPLVTPAHMRGRVLAVENVFIGASNELGAFESGVAAQLLGTTGAIALGGAATIAIAATWWRIFPALRDVDRFPDPVT